MTRFPAQKCSAALEMTLMTLNGLSPPSIDALRRVHSTILSAYRREHRQAAGPATQT